MKLTIEKRLRFAMGNKSSMQYHELMYAVFPVEDFPNAWRGATKGGPPGCARSFGSALDRYGYTTNRQVGGDRIVFAPVTTENNWSNKR